MGQEGRIFVTYIKKQRRMETKKKYYMECHLAGRKYYDADEVWDKLRVGTVVELERDLENKFDGNAVAVMYSDEEPEGPVCRGYIPREDNDTIAAFMDMGWGDIFECRISRVNAEAYSEQQIYLTIKIKRRQ